MIFDMPDCGACRTCEIVCSYHHSGMFNPSISSIKILEREEGSGYSVLFIEEYDGQSIPCDGCKGLDEPLCMEVCKEKEGLRQMIGEYLRRVGPR
jgi:Fe-S-cluster-containing dehydrogenase component